jgi:CRP-like cAMP-binding protein
MYLKSKVPFFSNYSGQTLANVVAMLDQIQFNRGQLVVKKGEVGREMYIIVVGKVGVFLDDSF